MAGEEYWVVLYKAMADFGDLMRKAAEAKAVLKDLGKTSGEVTAAQIAGEQKLVQARKAEIDSLKAEKTAVETTEEAWKRYNVQALYGGRSEMGAHLSDLSKELEYETLLNRQRWLGFSTPQQAYAWRQQEYQQRLLMNRAEWAGYFSADQFLAYQQKQIALARDQNAQLRDRAGLFRENADSALAYYNALKGTHKTLGQLGENLDLNGIAAFTAAVNSVPDANVTTLSVDDMQGLAAITKFDAALNAVPDSKTVVLNAVAGAAHLPQEHVNVHETVTESLPKLADIPVTFKVDDALLKHDLISLVAELHQIPPHVDITAGFDDTKAKAEIAAFMAFIKAHRVFGITENVDVLATGGAGKGGGGGSPPVVPAPMGPEDNPNDLNAIAKANDALAAALLKRKLAEHGVADAAYANAIASAKEGLAAAKSAKDASSWAYVLEQLTGKEHAIKAAAEDAAGAAALQGIASAKSGAEAGKFAYALNAVSDNLVRAGGDAKDTGANLSLMGQFVDGSVRGFGGLNTKLILFGGLLGGSTLLGAIKVWELFLHFFVEALAVLIPALGTMAVGLGLWAAAAADAAQKVYTQMKNVLTVSEATNQAVAPLTGSFEKLQKMVRPQVFQLFGDAITVMNHGTGAFNSLIMQTGAFLDHVAARITVFLTGPSKGFQDFLHIGANDLRAFGSILLSLGKILLDFIHASEVLSVAQHLLEGLAAILRVVADILSNKFAATLLAVAVGFRAVQVPLGLFVTGLKALALAIAPAVLGLTGLVSRFPVIEKALGGVALKTGATGEEMTKLAAKSPAVKTALDGLGNAFGDLSGVLGGTKLAVDKSGMSIADFGAKHLTPELQGKVNELGKGLEQVGKDALTLGALSGVPAKGLESIAAKAGESSVKVGLLDRAAGLLTKVPIGVWVAGAAVALGTLAYFFSIARSRAIDFANTLQSIVDKSTSFSVFGDLAKSYNAVGEGLAHANEQQRAYAGDANRSLAAAHQQASSYKDVGTNVRFATGAISAGVDATRAHAGAMAEAAGATNTYSNKQKDFGDQINNASGHLGALTRLLGGNYVQALQAANTAGLTGKQIAHDQGTAWAADLQQVRGLIVGYEAMGQRAGIVGGDLNALTVAGSNQLKAMQNLNTAWDTFTTTVAAPTTDILAVASSVNTFANDAKAAGASMSGLAGGIAQQARAITNSSVTLQNDFQTTFSSVQQLFDAFRSAQAINGGAGNFTQFVKDAVAALIPLAGKNKAAAAEISALAQEAGGPATTSLQALTKWSGNVKNPMEALYKASQQASVATANLSQDAAQLVNTLQQDMTPVMSQAILNAYGASQKFQAFGQAVIGAHGNIKAMLPSATSLANVLVAMLHSTGQAHDSFIAYAEGLGLSARQAEALWKQVTNANTAVQGSDAAIRKFKAEAEKAASAKNWAAFWRDVSNVNPAVKNVGIFKRDAQDAAKTGNWAAFWKIVSDTTPARRKVDAYRLDAQTAASTHNWSRFFADVEKLTGHAIHNQAVLRADAEAAVRTGNWDKFWRDLSAPAEPHGGAHKAVDGFKLNARTPPPQTHWTTWWANVTAPAEAAGAARKAVNTFKEIAGSNPLGHLWGDWWASGNRGASPSPAARKNVESHKTAAATPPSAALWQRFWEASVPTSAFWRTKLVEPVSAALGQLGSAWAHFWQDALKSFDGDFAGHLHGFFASTLPGWMNASAGLWNHLWDGAWADFDKTVAAQVGRFFTSTVPAWMLTSARDWQKLWTDAWRGFSSVLADAVSSFFTHSVPGWMAVSGRDWEHMWLGAWNNFVRILHDQLASFFEHTLPTWLNNYGRAWQQMWDHAWSDVARVVIAQLQNFFTRTLPEWLNATGQRWGSTWQNAWQLYSRVIVSGFRSFFQNDLTSWLNNTGTHWSRLWSTAKAQFAADIQRPLTDFFVHALPSAIEGGFRNSMTWVVKNGIDPIVNWINGISGGVGIAKIPAPRGFAGGGEASPVAQAGSVAGVGAYDHVGAVLMPGEYVVRESAVAAMEAAYGPGVMNWINQADTHLGGGSRGTMASQGYASGGDIPWHASGGEIYLAAGGYANPLRAVRGLTPMRIDMGVDYGGSGPVYAIGPGVILNTTNSGWPGGAFISERLTSGPDAGMVVYAAEHIVPSVRPGQTVNSSTRIGTLLSGYPFSEWGFATPDGHGQTLAAANHQQNPSGDPGAFTTAWGVAMSNLLSSLGAPPGIRTGPVHGTASLGGLFAPTTFGEGALSSFAKQFGKIGQVLATRNPGLVKLAKAGNATFDQLWSNLVGPLLQSLGITGGKGLVPNLGLVGLSDVHKAVNAMIAAAAAAAAQAGGIPGGITAGTGLNNLMQLARYLMSHGASRAAAAGIAGDVYGESAGNPESVGSGGFGLIGWTGNTIGLPPGYHGPTGNASRDLAIQIAGTLGYINANGGLGPINAAGGSNNYVAAGQEFSRAYERPAVLYSDTRPGVAAQIYSGLGGSIAQAQTAINVGGRVSFTHHAAGGYAGGMATGKKPLPKLTTAQILAREWLKEAASINTHWSAFLPEWHELDRDRPSPRKFSPAEIRSWDQDMALALAGLGRMDVQMDKFSHLSKVTTADLQKLLSPNEAPLVLGILRGETPPRGLQLPRTNPGAFVGKHAFATDMRDAAVKFAEYTDVLGRGYKILRSIPTSTSSGQGSTPGTVTPVTLPFTPGPRGEITLNGAPQVDLQPFATLGGPGMPVAGGPADASYGFGSGGGVLMYAAGGDVLKLNMPSLSDVAGQFGIMVQGANGFLPISIPAMAGRAMNQAAQSAAPARSLSEAGAASSRIGVNLSGDLVINNPRPEKPSDSIARANQRLAVLAGRGA